MHTKQRKLQNKLISRESSCRLEELCVAQNSQYYWIGEGIMYWSSDQSNASIHETHRDYHSSAFTENEMDAVISDNGSPSLKPGEFWGKNAADAKALALIDYLDQKEL